MNGNGISVEISPNFVSSNSIRMHWIRVDGSEQGEEIDPNRMTIFKRNGEKINHSDKSQLAFSNFQWIGHVFAESEAATEHSRATEHPEKVEFIWNSKPIRSHNEVYCWAQRARKKSSQTNKWKLFSSLFARARHVSIAKFELWICSSPVCLYLDRSLSLSLSAFRAIISGEAILIFMNNFSSHLHQRGFAAAFFLDSRWLSFVQQMLLSELHF